MEDIKRVQLSEIAGLITKGTTPTTLGYEFQEDGVNFLKIECFDENGGFIESKVAHISEECNEKLKRSQLKAGDVLFSIAGAIGRVAIVTEEMLPANTNQALAIIRIADEQVYLPYIRLILTSPIVIEQFEKKKQGVAQLNLSLKDINEISIPLPSKEKQIELAELFDKVAGVIAKRKTEISALDDLIKARFVEMFGNPEQNEKGWRTCRLGDECTVINGRAYKAEELLDEGKYRVLRVGNFFTNDSWYYSDIELDNDKYCDEGDLLFAWSASFGPRIWHGEKVIYHYHIWKLIGYENCLNKDFFVELLNYNCDVMKRGTHGSTMLHFTKSQMEDQLLILPPMQLQEQFADFVHQVDKSKFANMLITFETLKDCC